MVPIVICLIILCVCMRASVRVCMRACVHASERASNCVSLQAQTHNSIVAATKLLLSLVVSVRSNSRSVNYREYDRLVDSKL